MQWGEGGGGAVSSYWPAVQVQLLWGEAAPCSALLRETETVTIHQLEQVMLTLFPPALKPGRLGLRHEYSERQEGLLRYDAAVPAADTVRGDHQRVNQLDAADLRGGGPVRDERHDPSGEPGPHAEHHQVRFVGVSNVYGYVPRMHQLKAKQKTSPSTFCCFLEAAYIYLV